ncbi:hypothetical protein CEXT_288431 [Caerostris extrusa]|uniref:Uncharacterized protein n=1 Tax=Caerostris extrusa TaxID=172846 RepID=A0AAV4VF66_CAEEX|nr:hypothetical protein CEXT_288431 [Caerostris extrusa]
MQNLFHSLLLLFSQGGLPSDRLRRKGSERIIFERRPAHCPWHFPDLQLDFNAIRNLLLNNAEQLHQVKFWKKRKKKDNNDKKESMQAKLQYSPYSIVHPCQQESTSKQTTYPAQQQLEIPEALIHNQAMCYWTNTSPQRIHITGLRTKKKKKGNDTESGGSRTKEIGWKGRLERRRSGDIRLQREKLPAVLFVSATARKKWVNIFHISRG